MTENTPESPAAGTTTPVALLEWMAPSHHDHQRSHRWYVIAACITLGVAAYGIIIGAWSLTLVILLIAGMYFLTRGHPSALKYIRIERDGFQFQETFTPWNECKEFWIVRTPEYSELHIVRLKGIPRETVIQTGPIDPTVIRATVSQFLTLKGDQRERLLDLLLRLCKL
jgi:hypothetical protein